MRLTRKLLWTPLIIVVFLVSMTVVNVTSASPATYIYLDPPLIQGTPDGEFAININVADAPPSFAWEVHLSWDPDRLELPVWKVWDPILHKWVYVTDITEGDFLHRWYENPWPPPDYLPMYDTRVAYTSPDEANLEGEIIITGTLRGAYPYGVWADGDGWLMSIKFIVQAEGAAHLELSDTRLWDHYDPDTGYPASTDYPNEDGLVDATNFFYAGLAGWKLKVNGKSGMGLGLKSTVGTENVLEAKFQNDGNFGAYVQAFFEIKSETGYWIATVPSDIESLAAGGSTILDARWTAPGAGVYYITAYSLYGELTPDIPSGFSRTLRLKVVTN